MKTRYSVYELRPTTLASGAELLIFHKFFMTRQDALDHIEQLLAGDIKSYVILEEFYIEE